MFEHEFSCTCGESVSLISLIKTLIKTNSGSNIGISHIGLLEVLSVNLYSTVLVIYLGEIVERPYNLF